jgi:acyl-CoA thioester hydrolase
MNSSTQTVSTGKVLIEAPIALRWRDLDAFNHVNNSTFLTFIEEARLRWFASLAGPWFTSAYAPVVAATHVNYRKQMTWPGHIVVELYGERVGNTSVTIAHRIVDADDRSRVYSDGYTVLVWIDLSSGKSVSLPEAVRNGCQ